jgi:hypothetical protein
MDRFILYKEYTIAPKLVIILDGNVHDDDDGEGFATFGMALDELIEVLASIKISACGLESILKTNKGLSQKETALILVALENHKDLYNMLSLGGTVSNKEVMRCVRKTYMRIDLFSQLEFLRGSILQNTQKNKKPVVEHIEDPDPAVKGIFGNEYT